MIECRELYPHHAGRGKKGKASSLDIAPLTILNSGALQPRKWQLTGNDCLVHLAEASPKELWNAVRAKTKSRTTHADIYLSNPDTVNNYFASIATDDSYSKYDVLHACVK